METSELYLSEKEIEDWSIRFFVLYYLFGKTFRTRREGKGKKHVRSCVLWIAHANAECTIYGKTTSTFRSLKRRYGSFDWQHSWDQRDNWIGFGWFPPFVSDCEFSSPLTPYSWAVCSGISDMGSCCSWQVVAGCSLSIAASFIKLLGSSVDTEALYGESTECVNSPYSL